MDRMSSYNSDSLRSDKTEKRRSGFFGMGKKEKEKEVSEAEIWLCDEGEEQGRHSIVNLAVCFTVP